MRTFVRRNYGSPDVLELLEADPPAVGEGAVLVRVHAASVNPLDWYMTAGTPFLVRTQGGLRRPKSEQVGVDFAGTVEAVGENVTRLQPGDEVLGGRTGAFAEYVSVPEDGAMVLKPANLTFEQAAAVPIAGITALQGLRDKGQVQPGHEVLINGASGGVGTFAVQIAKSFGANVTGVCRTRNVDRVRSLGADHVVDYTQEDFTRSDRRYDLLLDIAGNRSWSEYSRVLKPDATLVVVGGPKGNPLIGPLSQVVKMRVASLRASQKVVAPFLASVNREDLEVLHELLESGQVTPSIDRRYELGELPEALDYIGEGHARAKVVVTM